MALTVSQIQNAYVAFFNRPADVAGLNYWSGYAGSETDLLNTFAVSDEYTSLYTGLNSTQIVNKVYGNLFGHDADLAGLNYWVGKLAAGDLKIGNIADAINKGAQGTDATAVANKTIAATAFTTALDTAAEVVAYSAISASGLASVTAWLSAVTDTAASLTAATSAAGIAAITATVVSNVAATGSTFTLTTGTTVYTGGTGDDTFIGSAGVIDGVTINAGAGDDTLTLSLNSDDDASSFVATDLENLTVRLLSSATAAVAIDLSEVTGLETLTARRVADAAAGVDLTFENIQDTAIVLTLENISADDVEVTFDFDDSVVTGTADQVTLNVDSVTATTGTASGTAAVVLIDGDIEIVNLVSVGDGNVLTLVASGATALNVSGGDIEFALALSANIVSVDASEMTGGITLELAATASVSVTGGAGDDSINVSALAAAGTTSTSIVDAGAGNDAIVIDAAAFNFEGLTIDGGTGTDTLTVTLAAAATAVGTSTATVAAISGIETIVIDASAVTGTVAIDLSALGLATAVDTIEIDAGGAGAVIDIENMVAEDLVLSLTGSNTVTLTASLTTTTGTADAISIAIGAAADLNGTATTNNVTLNLNLDQFESISLELSSTTTETIDLDVDSTGATAINIVVGADVTAEVDLTTVANLATLVLSGSGDVVIDALSLADGVEIDASALSGNLTATVTGTAITDKVSFTGGSGDDVITIGDGRFTVAMGAGDDTLTIDSDLTSRDSFDGGTGTDTIVISIATDTSVDLVAANFEILDIDVTGAGSVTATVAVDMMTALTAIQVTVGSADSLSITGVDLAELKIDITNVDVLGALTVSNSASSAVANLTVASTGSADVVIGDIVLSDFVTVNLDLSVSSGTVTATLDVEISNLTATAATSLVITGDDDNLANTTAFAIDLADGATIDLTGFGSGDIGAVTASTDTVTLNTASATVATAAGIAETLAVYSIAGGISLNTGSDYTIELGDAATSSQVTLIDFGLNTATLVVSNDGADTIVINDTSSTADNVGDVVILGFLGGGDHGVTNTTRIDLSDWTGIADIYDLTIAAIEDGVVFAIAADGDPYTQGVTITSSAFDGTITLIGVSEANIDSSNFVFA
jgi:hypothetical protein